MSSKSELLVIDEILLIARAVKRHLKETNCNHNIQFIVDEALNRANGLAGPTTTSSTDDANIPKDQLGNAYTGRYK